MSNPLPGRSEIDEARHALALATAWITVMDDVMPVTEEECTQIACEFVRLRSLSDADIEAAHQEGTRDASGDGFAPAEVETVARAICLSNRDDPDKEWLLADGRRDILGWQQYEGDAKAAIIAMRLHAKGGS